MTRTILHSDCNNFYASVECALHPEWRGLPLAVCGSQEMRHGIVLAKSEQAKRFGIRTGDTIWQARKKCPQLRIITPTFGQYQIFSRKMRAIYADYTDRVEPFGMDECFLDVTGCPRDGVAIAADIRRRARAELGITVSVGVSFNKVFAKLGSDLRKPDATTVITPENFRDKLWPLPAEDLLFVGRRMCSALHGRGMYTIGDIARADAAALHAAFGKSGDALRRYALGLDQSPVRRMGDRDAPKSIGNSTTPPRDMASLEDVRIVLRALCDEVAMRLRQEGMQCRTVTLWVRDHALRAWDRQRMLRHPTCLSAELFDAALDLLLHCWDGRPLRSLGVRGGQLVDGRLAGQTSVFPDERREKQEKLERAVDDIALRYGRDSLRRAVFLGDHVLSGPS